MKKIYFLALSLVLGFSANAQVTENFDSYPLGPYFGGNWTTWSGASGAENIIISNDQAASGTQSGYVGNDGVQDAVLMLGNKSSGVWTYEMKMYIEFGLTGYFNFQEDQDPAATGGVWGLSFHFNDQVNYADYPDQGILYGGDEFFYPFDFPYDQWFTLKYVYDIAANTVVVTLDGTEIYNGLAGLDESPSAPQLGGVDFFSIHANNSYYVDDIVFSDSMGVTDMTGSTISVYPTVVKDNVNISAKSNISDIAVFNTAGQQVMKANPNAQSTQVNMSALPSGVYIVKIQAGKETLTKKVVVK